MKAKFGQTNQANRYAAKSLENNKQNQNKSNQQVAPKGKRQFGKDITKETIQVYDFTTVKDSKNVLKLPITLKEKCDTSNEIAPYQQDIMEYIINTHRQNEFSTAYKKKIMNKRSKRINLVQFQYKTYKTQKLRRKTFHLSVYYLDRYLQHTNESKYDKMLLIAEACMLIAMKYEEIYPPYLRNWAKHNAKEVIEMQSQILKYLNFKLAYTTAQHYLQIYQGKNMAQSKQRKQLIELVIDLYLFTGNIYSQHPLKVVQQIQGALRTTSFLQKNTTFEENDMNVKKVIVQFSNVWEFLLEFHNYMKLREK